MADPFAAALVERRLQLSFGLLLLVILTAAVAFLSRQTLAPKGSVDAQVIRFGSYATDIGERPLVVVQLADGSTRQIATAPAALRDCRVGGHISLVRTGAGFRVGHRACN